MPVDTTVETNSVSNGIEAPAPAEYVSPQQDFEESQSNGAAREFVPAAPVAPAGFATQPPPSEAQPAVEKFANMQGLFRQEPDSDAP